MEYSDNYIDYLMLSGIQHFEFCQRQWALIHIEQQWQESVSTLEGEYLHKKVDQPFIREKRNEKLIVRAMPVQSALLRVSGICDVVEFVDDENGISLANEVGSYKVFPVEYKRGKPKANDADELQLVAQAMCLEEMLFCEINKGYIYYNEIKHRIEVNITEEKKDQVKNIFLKMHEYMNRGYTPKVKTGPHCKKCSLEQLCMPGIMSRASVSSYIESRIKNEKTT